MSDRRRGQRGMTLIGLLITLVLIGVVALVGIRLVPVYIEAYSVGSILEGMASEPRLSGGGRAALRESFGKRLEINDVQHVTRRDLTFEDVNNGIRLSVDYEARVHMLANLDAVAVFHKEAVVPN